MAEFYVTVHQSEHGYDVSCPTLKGCHSQGETEEEALENIRDAIEAYLAAFREMTREEEVRTVEVAV